MKTKHNGNLYKTSQGSNYLAGYFSERTKMSNPIQSQSEKQTQDFTGRFFSSLFTFILITPSYVNDQMKQVRYFQN